MGCGGGAIRASGMAGQLVEGWSLARRLGGEKGFGGRQSLQVAGKILEYAYLCEAG